MPRRRAKRRSNYAVNFVFWMTLIGLGMAAFFALLAVTTFAIGTVTKRIATTWEWPAQAAPAAPAAVRDLPPQELPPIPFTTYRQAGYEFTNPGDWQVKPTKQMERFNDYIVAGGSVTDVGLSYTEFVNAAGGRVASMRCPPQETGYEMSDVTSRELRQFQNNGKPLSAELVVLTPTGLTNAVPDIARIMVAPGSDPYLADDDKFLATCTIIASSSEGDTVDVAAMRRVYESLR